MPVQPTLRYKRPLLYAAQARAIFSPKRYAVVEASTKSGKTTGCLIWILEQAMQGHRGWAYWWIAPVFAQAKVAFRRMKRAIPRSIYTANESELTLTLLNGAVLWFKSAENPDSLYGEDVHAAVIDEATRCFVAGTLVDTPAGPRRIESLRVGDAVMNAAGVGHVQRLIRKKSASIAVVKVQEYTMVSSVDHRFFTHRGWVEAQHLERSDILVTQREAVRILRQTVCAPSQGQQEPTPAVLQSAMSSHGQGGPDPHSSVCVVWDGFYGCGQGTTDSSFLRAELLIDLEDATARDSSACAWAGGPRQDECWTPTLLGIEYASGAKSTQRTAWQGNDAPGKDARQGVRCAEGDWTSAASEGRQREASHGASAPAAVASRVTLPSGILRQDGSGPQEGRAAAALPDRHRPSDAKACDRDRRHVTQGAAGDRCAQDGLPGIARVESVEVLQSGDPRFGRYSGDSDRVDLYDLTVTGHPSFSVNGFLVHNCRAESWHAVRSTLTATRGHVRIIGNVKGRRNWAYQLARKAEAGEPGMHYARITAYDAAIAGIFDSAEIEDARRTLPEDVFRQLYLAEPTEDEGNPFGIAAIQDCIGPLSTAPPVVWGWDLAKSVDWTVGIGLDAAGRTSGFERFQAPWETTIGRIQTTTARAPALVDSTGVGDPVLESLQRGGATRYEGYKFTGPSKQQLMEGLAVAIQQGQVSYPDGPIVHELESFEYVYTRNGVRYSAPSGMHDDCVVSLALAVQHLKVRAPVLGLEKLRGKTIPSRTLKGSR